MKTLILLLVLAVASAAGQIRENVVAADSMRIGTDTRTITPDAVMAHDYHLVIQNLSTLAPLKMQIDGRSPRVFIPKGQTLDGCYWGQNFAFSSVSGVDTFYYQFTRAHGSLIAVSDTFTVIVGYKSNTGGPLNGSFEDTVSSSNFASWTETAGAGCSVKDTTTVYSGSHAARLHNGASTEGVDVRQNVLVAGKIYTISFWAKRCKASTTRLKLYYGGAGGNKLFTLTDDWKEYKWQGVADDVTLMLVLYDTDMDAILDDVQVTRP